MRNERLRSAITSEDVLGKDVIDSTGCFIGVTDTLYIDPKNFCILGISIDKGFMRKGLLVGKDHIKEIAKHAIFLSIQPSPQLRGKEVFDRTGAHVGIVTKVVQIEGTNDIDHLVIRRGWFSRRLHVSGKLVKSTGTGIFLSTTADQLTSKPPR